MTEQIQPENEPTATEEVVLADKKADAKERSYRTLKQSLLVTVGIAVVTAALQGISVWTGEDFMSAASWSVLVVSVIQSGATAILSYINRYTHIPEHTAPINTRG